MGIFVGLGGHFSWTDTPYDSGFELTAGRRRKRRQLSMVQKLQRLTALAVNRVSKPGLYADGGGIIRPHRNGSPHGKQPSVCHLESFCC